MHLYAIDHWVDHLLALSNLLGSHPGGFELELLLRGLERLTDMHQNLDAWQSSSVCKKGDPILTQREDRWPSLGISPAARGLLDRVLTHRETVSSSQYWQNVPHCKHAILEASESAGY